MRIQSYIANLIPLMRSQPQPIIAAVNGAASGGGMALTLGSDIRIAAASARFNVAFIRVGSLRLRHRDELDPPAPHRRVARVRADAHRPLRGRRGSVAHRVGHAGRRGRRIDGRRPRRGRADPRERAVRRAHDQGGHVEPTRDRQHARGHRPREPHPGPLDLRGRSRGGDGRLRRRSAHRTSRS